MDDNITGIQPTMSADPVYERRELTRTVSVPSKYLQRSIQTSLLGQLKANVEGRCGMEGYIAKDSITILSHSMGRVNTLNEKVEYRVRFQSDICMPHPGQVFRVLINFRSKIGVHCEMEPMKILLPRDLHLGNPEFESLAEGDEIEVEVVGSQFQQQDTHIYVLSKYLRRISVARAEGPAPTEEAEVNVEELKPLTNEEAPKGDTKSISVAPENLQAEPSKVPARRRKRLAPAQPSTGILQLNVGATNAT